MKLTDAERQMAWNLVHGMLMSARALAGTLVNSLDAGLSVVSHLHVDQRPESPFVCCACFGWGQTWLRSFRVGSRELYLCESCGEQDRAVFDIWPSGLTKTDTYTPVSKHRSLKEDR